MNRLLPLVTALGLVLAGCVGNDERIVYAEFTDVIDLVTQASVRAGDVTVGTVKDISLTDAGLARVAMELDPDVVLPADTDAWLSKTSLLGERFIDLRPIGTEGSLQHGDVITDTRIITDFEDLVGTGSEVLGGLAADQIAIAVRAGAEALGGRGALLGQVIEDVRALVGRYEDGADTITRLIDELALLTAELAPDAAANAADLDLLRSTTTALDAQDEALLDALAELQRLATVGERILEDHEGDLDNSLRRLRILLEEVNSFDEALERLLINLPGHNLNVPDGSINELAQVWTDFMLCGAQDEEGNLAQDCDPPNPNQIADPPVYDPCPQEQVRCPSEIRPEASR